MKIASVFSFTGSNKLDIPYVVSKEGESKKDGGNGVVYTCTCPQYFFRCRKNKTRCKHINLVIDVIEKDLIDERVMLCEEYRK